MDALIAAIAPFAVSMSATPGPNNLMITASAVNFGVCRTLPHMAGVWVGFPAMVLAVGLGFGAALAAAPMAHAVLRWVGAAYLLWLAWRIANAAPAASGAVGKPLTFLEAALFQWVNPKAWMMIASASATYTTPGGDLAMEMLIIAAVFAAIGPPSSLLWAGFGAALRRWLDDPARRRAFNWSMAGLLVLSLIPVLR